MREERSVAVIIAAIAWFLNSLSNLGTLAAPIPRAVVYASVGAGVTGLAGAYGVWQLKRWGAALSVVILAVTVLLAAPGIPFAPNLALHVLAGAIVIVDMVAVFLLAMPSSRRAYA
jgi:hypothetical protein